MIERGSRSTNLHILSLHLLTTYSAGPSLFCSPTAAQTRLHYDPSRKRLLRERIYLPIVSRREPKFSIHSRCGQTNNANIAALARGLVRIARLTQQYIQSRIHCNRVADRHGRATAMRCCIIGFNDHGYRRCHDQKMEGILES
jgi:hypothetical protein